MEIVRTRSLGSLVAEEVERMIVSGEIPAGERLNEVALATQLQVSRAPVREAIRGLERSGLVVTVVNQGSYVRQVSAAEAIDIYRVRAVLTGFACAELAQDIKRPQLARLRGLVRQMDAMQQANEAASYYALNRTFHAALLKLAGNACTTRLCEGLGNELNLFRRRTLVPVESMRESNAEHGAIVSAIAAGDSARAREAGEIHILGGMRRFVAMQTDPNNVPQRDGAAPKRGATKINGRKTDGNFEEDAPADSRRSGGRHD